MMSDRVLPTKVAPERIFGALSSYCNGLDKRLLASTVRSYTSSRIIDLIDWTTIGKSSASGKFKGAAGKVFRGSLVSITGSGNGQMAYAIQTPSWARNVFWVGMIICIFIPPFWIMIALGLFMVMVHKSSAPMWMRRLQADLELLAS